MISRNVYVAPDYKISFSIGGDWFEFLDGSFGIIGSLKNGDWGIRIYDNAAHLYAQALELVSLPYKTLVLFRKALAIKGLEYVLDKEITLVEEK